MAHFGDQLQLDLDWGREPWEGWLPGALTKGRKVLFLRPEPPCHEVDMHSEQLDLFRNKWLPEVNAPPRISRGGAPSLLRLY